LGTFWDRVPRTICPGWLWTSWSLAWLARIIGVSRWYLTLLSILITTALGEATLISILDAGGPTWSPSSRLPLVLSIGFSQQPRFSYRVGWMMPLCYFSPLPTGRVTARPPPLGEVPWFRPC
jgi:hypothetical protein